MHWAHKLGSLIAIPFRAARIRQRKAAIRKIAAQHPRFPTFTDASLERSLFGNNIAFFDHKPSKEAIQSYADPVDKSLDR